VRACDEGGRRLASDSPLSVDRSSLAFVGIWVLEYVPSVRFPKVTGTLFNPHPVDLDDVRASILAYDHTGRIIGSGVTTVDELPADGEAPLEVYLTISGTPASFELSSRVSSLDDLR